MIDSVEAIGGQTAPVHIMNTYLKRADRQSFSVIADNNFLNKMKPYTITPLFLNIYSYAAITNKQMVAGRSLHPSRVHKQGQLHEGIP